MGYLLVTPTPAWAYIDPGTGSYLFQLAAAGALSGVYLLRRYWGHLKSLLTRTGSLQKKAPAPGTTDRDGHVR